MHEIISGGNPFSWKSVQFSFLYELKVGIYLSSRATSTSKYFPTRTLILFYFSKYSVMKYKLSISYLFPSFPYNLNYVQKLFFFVNGSIAISNVF